MNNIEVAKKVFNLEIAELEFVKEKINFNFSEVVELILETKGKVIVTGIGKSGIIGRKIASSLASTGTSSFFMQSAEALHGDLGMVKNDDIVIAISNSGKSQEVLNIIPSLKKIGCKIVAMTGDKNSELALSSQYVLDIGIREEACPMKLAPTSSTTATLLLGDALTVALIEKRKFKKENFALYHPGGALGKRLLTKVEDIMTFDIPKVSRNAILTEVIYEISSKRLGLTTVIDEEDEVIGIITDGDIRRKLVTNNDITILSAKDLMIKNFKTIKYDCMANEAWEKMNQENIGSLIVIKNKKVIGIITMHDVFEFKKVN